MAIVKKITDPIRVKILSAMKKKGCVTPNIRQIKKVTGFHRATIKSSIDFFESEKFITGYRPLLDPSVVGFNLNSYSYLQLDNSQKDAYKKFLSILEKDKHAFIASEVISENNTNFAIGIISKNIEDYYNNIKTKYTQVIPNYYDFVKKNSVFYLSSPHHKRKNIIDVTIDLLEEEYGIEEK